MSVQEMIDRAEKAHEQYPQYKGHWNGWIAVRIRRDLRSRGASIARKGEVVLMHPDGELAEDHPDVVRGIRRAGMCTVHLPGHWHTGGMDTSIAYKDVEVLT